MNIFTLADYCQALGLPCCMVPDVIEVFQNRELARLAQHEARMRRCAARPDREALPYTDESGYEWGRVEARIPKTLFWNLATRKNFGWEGLNSEDGLAEILKDNPQCRVRTVSGRAMTGWTPGRRTIKKYSLCTQ